MDIAAETDVLIALIKMNAYPKKTKAKPAALPEQKKEDKPSFYDAVFDVVRRVPKGRVTSYGAVAEATGLRLSARMVGWALRVCGKATPPVPAHRVVNRLGILSGKHHFATPTLMQDLLEQEGVRVKNDTVVDFKKLFWDPADLKKAEQHNPYPRH